MQSKLTQKQERFVQEYLIDLNATQAAIRAGYSCRTARSIGQENLTKPAIQQAIQERTGKVANRLELKAEAVIQRLADIAFSELGQVASWDSQGNMTVRPSHEMTPAERAGIENIQATGREDGTRTISITLANRMRALELLGRYFGLWGGDAIQQNNQQNNFILDAQQAREILNNLGCPPIDRDALCRMP